LHFRHLIVALTLTNLLGASCSREKIAGDSSALDLRVVTSSSPEDNPYQDVFKLEFQITRRGEQVFWQEVEWSESEFPDGASIQLDPLEFELDEDQWDELRLSLTGWVLGPQAVAQEYSRGRTAPFQLQGQDQQTSVSLYLSPIGEFSSPGQLLFSRFGHTASLLPDGQVLIVGGAAGGSPDAPTDLVGTAEFYDTSAGFYDASDLVEARIYHTSTVLADGRVLVYGGMGTGGGAIATAEVFDDGMFESLVLDPAPEPRLGHTASLLPDGRVLIAGGAADFPVASSPRGDAFIIDPQSGETTPVQNQLARPRAFHKSVPTGNMVGEVVLAGGFDDLEVTDTLEIYTPDSNDFRGLNPSGEGRQRMLAARAGHSATLLLDGNVLLMGGRNQDPFGADGDSLLSVDVWSVELDGLIDTGGSLPQAAREWHTATVLEDNRILTAGGRTREQGVSTYLDTAELFEPDDHVSTVEYDCTFAPVEEDRLSQSRVLHTATMLPDGNVLIVGGLNEGGVVSNAEIYNPDYPAP
jgi:hypothetical protein